MCNTQHSETPDGSVVSFNTNYETAQAIFRSSNPGSFTRSLDDVVNEMAGEIYRVCHFLVEASPTEDILCTRLKRVFESGETLYLDSWGPVNIKVLPPNRTRNVLDRQLGDPATFQMGYLILEVEGDAKVDTGDRKERIVSRLTGLFAMIDPSQ